jgi:hypothetical protein
MSARQLLALGVLVAGLIAAVMYWNQRVKPREMVVDGLIFPELAQRQDSVASIDILGAGNAALVRLRKRDGHWRVLERSGWPADAGKISQTLFTLAQAHLQEAKTTNPDLYSKIGVEPLTVANAQGLELRLDGGGKPMRLLIGHTHVGFDGEYVRVNDGAQSWLTDRRLDISRDPIEWLDRHLLDRPLARIEQVQVKSSDGSDFTLVHADDRFVLANVPPAAMGDSHGGDAMAGFLDQLNFDDVADDDGKTPAERTVRFIGIDGAQVDVHAWRVDGKVWIRVESTLDSTRAEAWLAKSGKDDPQQRAAALEKLRQEAAALQSKCAGKRFLLPAFKSAVLLMGRSQVLEGDE